MRYLSKVVHMLSCNLAEAPVRERDEDRSSREEVKKYILTDPIDLVNLQFVPKVKYKP